jgi:thiol-disulfide isomerase/thioredoxin
MDADGNEINIFDLDQQETVLVFWASWCPHCMQEMPKLQAWAKEHPETLVLAVSLDDDYAAFQQTIEEFPNMLHYCDLQKWEGTIAENYFIAATPTLFSIDASQNIINKFSSIASFLSK